MPIMSYRGRVATPFASLTDVQATTLFNGVLTPSAAAVLLMALRTMDLDVIETGAIIKHAIPTQGGYDARWWRALTHHLKQDVYYLSYIPDVARHMPSDEVGAFIETIKSHACQESSEMPYTPAQTASQKVLGLQVLGNSQFANITLPIVTVVGKDWLERSEATRLSDFTMWSYRGKLFARPCPLRPRHGFVDSQTVDDADGLAAVLRETLAAEPDGVVMLMHRVDANMSMVWTPSMLAVGAGHDGATAGREAMSFPLGGVIPEGLTKSLLRTAGVKNDEDPYIEAVLLADSYPRLVQLRAGPKVEPGIKPDYVPADRVVDHILNTRDYGDDLVKWEAAIKAAGPGTVVYHPGGSPVDHFFVHARTLKIPVLTMIKPVIGMSLKQNDTKLDLDPLSVLRGVVAGDVAAWDSDHLDRPVLGLLLALHYSGALQAAEGRFIGMAASTMLRAGSMALFGEARHLGHPPDKKQRHDVYKDNLGRSLNFHQRWLPRNFYMFRYGGWHGGGFGGDAWAKCALALDPLFRAVRQLACNPDQVAVGELVRALNSAVNQAHNGGWWLNKFVDSSTMGVIQQGDLRTTLNAGRGLFELEQSYRVLDPSQIEEVVSRYQRWRGEPLSAPRVKDIALVYLPGAGALHVEPRMRALRNTRRVFTIPLDQLAEQLSGKLGSLVVDHREDKGGLAVRCDGPDGSQLVWREEELKALEALPSGDEEESGCDCADCNPSSDDDDDSGEEVPF